jgi:hypothetical protein
MKTLVSEYQKNSKLQFDPEVLINLLFSSFNQILS